MVSDDDKEKVVVRILNISPLVLDIIAIVASLIGSIAFAPFFAFSHDDIQAAGIRYNDTMLGRSRFWNNSTTVVAEYCVLTSSVSAALCLLSMVCAVVVRIAATYVEHGWVPPTHYKTFSRAMAPLIWLSMFSLVAALLLFVFGFYWIGWIIFPPSVADGGMWFWAGAWIIISLAGIFLYLMLLLTFLYCDLRRKKKVHTSRSGV